MPKNSPLKMSQSFKDPLALLASCEEMGLEGIVSKDQPYKSGKNVGWVMVKTLKWRAANLDRPDMF